MAIEQHCVVALAGNLDEDDRGAPGVRPGSLTTSRVAPGREGSFARAQRSNSAKASSM